jgi:hypothetical protein
MEPFGTVEIVHCRHRKQRQSHRECDCPQLQQKWIGPFNFGTESFAFKTRRDEAPVRICLFHGCKFQALLEILFNIHQSHRISSDVSFCPIFVVVGRLSGRESLFLSGSRTFQRALKSASLRLMIGLSPPPCCHEILSSQIIFLCPLSFLFSFPNQTRHSSRYFPAIFHRSQRLCVSIMSSKSDPPP